MQQRPQRLRDVAGSESRRRDLVQERLKEMVVRAIDDGDVNGGSTKGARGFEARESSAHDHDTASFVELIYGVQVASRHVGCLGMATSGRFSSRQGTLSPIEGFGPSGSSLGLRRIRATEDFLQLEITYELGDHLQQRPDTPLRPTEDLAIAATSTADVRDCLAPHVTEIEGQLSDSGLDRATLGVEAEAVEDGVEIHLRLTAGQGRLDVHEHGVELRSTLDRAVAELLREVESGAARTLVTLPPKVARSRPWNVLVDTVHRFAQHELEALGRRHGMRFGQHGSNDVAQGVIARRLQQGDTIQDPARELPGLLAEVELAIAELAERDAPQVSSHAAPPPSPRRVAEVDEERRRLTEALFELDDADRRLFAHAVVDLVPVPWLARLYETPETAIESRLEQLLTRLETTLGTSGAALVQAYADLGETLRNERLAEARSSR